MVLTSEYFHKNKHSLNHSGFWFVCQKSQNFFTHLHFCRENFWCLIRRINFFERCDISLLFSLHSQRWRISFFSQFRRLQKCEMLNSCRSKTRLSVEDIRLLKHRNSFKVFLPFFQRSSSKWRTFFGTFSISSQRKKMNIGNRLQVWARQNKFLSALYRREKVCFERFSNISWDIDERILANQCSEM